MKQTMRILLSAVLTLALLVTALAVPSWAADPVTVTLHIAATTQPMTGQAGTTMPLFVPEAPEGKYFAGWYTDSSFFDPVVDTVFTADGDYYACFVDQRDHLTDTFAGYSSTVKNIAIPYQSGGAYFQKIKRNSYSFKGVSGGYGNFHAYSTWSEYGVYFITDENSHVFITQPKTAYEITVTYRLSSKNSESEKPITICGGYDFPIARLSDGDMTNNTFAHVGPETVVTAITEEWQTLTYSFVTGEASQSNLPVAGIRVYCSGKGENYNQLQVKSISIGTVDSKASVTTYVGGTQDRVISGTVGDPLELYTPEAPEGKYFSCWCTDEACTVPFTGTLFEKSVTALYAKFVDPMTVTAFVDGKADRYLTGIPGATMPLYVPAAPADQYFVGWCSDEGLEQLLSDFTYKDTQTAVYAKFATPTFEGTDTFAVNAAKVKFNYPYMLGGVYYPTISDSSWSFKTNGASGGEFYPSNTWAEQGAYYATTNSGEPIMLKDYCHYKVTVTYRLSSKKTELGAEEYAAKMHIGYGFPIERLTTSGGMENKDFKYIGESVPLVHVTEDWQTMTYEFDTEQMEDDLLPVAGIMVSLTGKGSVASKVLVKSICLEKTEYPTCNIQLNGGYTDRDLTKSPDKATFADESAMVLPVAYRNRYAFDGWYADAELTGPAVTTAVKNGTYYAKWVKYGDADANDAIDTGDLALLKKELAGINEAYFSAGGDNNADGVTDTLDLLLLKKYLAGLEDYMGPVRYIAFTFDDGPNSYLPKIGDEFDRYKGHCTFFVISDYLHLTTETTPYLEDAIRRGNQIGNHSHSHGHPAEWLYEGTLTNMGLCQEKIYDAVGYTMTVGRLPFLEANADAVRAMEELGLGCIGSGVDTGDTDSNVSAQEEAERIKKNAYDGAIVLMHATEKSYNALRLCIDELHDNGFKFVTVEELFREFGYDSVPLGEQLTCAVRQNAEK